MRFEPTSVATRLTHLGLLTALVAANLSAQVRRLTVDLARDPGKTTEVSVPAGGELQVTIISLVPSARYSVFIETGTEPIPPLSISRLEFRAADSEGPRDVDCSRAVREFKLAYDSLRIEDEESQVGRRLNALREAIRKLDNVPNCDPTGSPSRREADSLIARTMHEEGRTYRLDRGERLEVTLVREGETEGESRIWKFVYTTGPRGQWLTTYGFSFIADMFNREKTYYTKPENSGFVITKETDRRSIVFVPTLFFAWMPASRANSTFAYSVSGGLGFDLANPVVLLGFSVTYNYNLALSVGVAAHRQLVLRGKYQENQSVAENLDEGQLHEELYRINPYVAITFRFGSNPFAQESGNQ